MCYDIKSSLEKQLRRAILDGDKAAIDQINEKLSIFTPDQIELHHSSGFDHPNLIIYTNKEPYKPILSQWGLVPHWVKNVNQKNSLWNRTVNARGESIFENPSFRSSAKSQRCLIYLEGFYEHRHFKGKTYPYFISHKKEELFAVAGLYSTWFDKEMESMLNTFSIVTTKANKLMSKIHNNPKLAEPRMPLILPKALENNWLEPIIDENDKKLLQELIQPYPDNELRAYTVGKLRGKDAVGNVKEVSNEVEYSALTIADSQQELF